MSRFKETLTVEDVKELWEYDPKTGNFIWKVDRSFRKIKCKIAGTTHPSGYVYLIFKRSRYSAHRVAWLWMTGEWPEDQIDHINRIRDDNRWKNLREATASQNLANYDKPKDNTSGFRGVDFAKKKNKWRARIMINGKRIELGYFNTAKEASEVYLKFYVNYFGEFTFDPTYILRA